MSTANDENSATVCLSIGIVLSNALTLLWRHKHRIAKATTIPATIYFTVILGATMLGEQNRLYGVLVSVLIFLPLTLLAVNVHRVVILGTAAVPEHGLNRWTGRETKFAGWVLGTTFVVGATIFPLLILTGMMAATLPISRNHGELSLLSTFFTFIPAVPAWLPGLYLGARLSLILPATAIDQRPRVGWAWKLSHGNGWRLCVLVFLVPMLLAWLQSLLEKPFDSFVADIASAVVTTLVAVFEIAVLSGAYQVLAGEQGHRPES